jgi:hypothetical protein
MIYCYRFRNPYKTINGSWIYEIKSSGLTEKDAEANAMALVDSCEFLTDETKQKMKTDINWTNPVLRNAVFVIGG